MKKKIAAAIALFAIAVLAGGCAGLFNRPPVASFTWNPTSPSPNEVVRFDASASSDPDSSDSLSFSWNFGDGKTGTGIAVSHSYAKSGTYSVTLAVEDGCGKSDSLTQKITVRHCPIKISGVNIRDLNGGRVEAGDRLQLCVYAERCGVSVPATEFRAVWSFGDGSATKTGQCVEHCFERGCREYTVRVTVTDSTGTDSVSKCLYVYCRDGCPTAVIKWQTLRVTGLVPVPACGEIWLDGRDSHDNDKCCVSCECPACPPNLCPMPNPCDEQLSPQGCGDCQVPCSERDRIVSWKWEIFPPTGSSIVKWGATVKFFPTQNGQHLVRLSVKDDEGGWDTKATHIQVDGCGCSQCP